MFGIERRKKVRLTREFTIACNKKKIRPRYMKGSSRKKMDHY